MTEKQSQFVKLMERAARRHNSYVVFKDFCAITAISFYNAIFKDPAKEKEYAHIMGKYTKEEADCFPAALAVLAEALEERVHDFLGVVYQELGANNKAAGQFFTPYHLCELMTNVSVVTDNWDKRLINLIEEPACGSGAMLLPICERIRQRPETNNKFLFVATDLDLTCVHMAYIQLTLCGANAVIKHANTLTLEVYSTWPTIAYIGNREELERRMMAQEMMDIFHNPAERKSNDIIVPETLAQKGLLFDLGGIGT